MSNPLFNLLGGVVAGSGTGYNQNGLNSTPLQRLAELKRNPAQVIRSAGYTIPNGLTTPQQILNHLLQSGQIDQGKLQRAQMLASQFRM